MPDHKQAGESKVYEFGPFVLNPALGELTRAGEGVEIQRRVLDLLTYLLDHRDRTVSKDELQDAVWPGTVVTEAALARAVMKARRALADDGQEQRFIRTVHGRGYRFVADVDLRRASSSEQEPREARGRRQAVWRVATAYAAAAWLVNQAAAMVWEAFEWPRWPQQGLLALSLVGLPLVVVLTWFYRFTATGIALRSERGRDAPRPASVLRERVVIAMLAVALVLSVSWNLRGYWQVAAPAERVVVLPMRNDTGDQAFGWLSFGMLSLLQSQLADARIPVASAAEVIRQFPEAPADVDAALLEQLARTEGARYVVSASVVAVGGQFRADTALFDRGERLAVPSFTGESPSAAVRALGRHLASLISPDLPDPRFALDSGDAFVDQAYARGMHELLSGNLSRARDLLQVAADSAPDEFWPNYELALVTRRLGDLEAGRAMCLTLLEQARRDDEPLHVAVLSNELGIIGDLAGELDQSERHYAEGLEWATRAGLHERRAALLVNYAILERARANPVAARELLGRALTAYRDAGIEVLPGDFYITVGNTAADAGDFAGALAQYRQALESFRVAKRPSGEGIALSNLSWASEQLGDFDGARQYLDDSLALRKRIGDEVGVLRSQIRKADLLYTLGRFDEVLTLVDAVMTTSYARAEPEILSTAYRFHGTVAEERGQYPASASWFRQALDLDERDGRARGVCEARLGLIRTYIAQGELVEAERELTVLLDEADARSLPHVRLEGLQQRARLLRARGEDESVLAELKAALDEARRQANVRMVGLLAADLADIYFEQGDEGALSAWVGVALDVQPQQGHVKLAAAQLAILRKDLPRATELLGEASTLLGERLLDKQESLRGLVTQG